MNWRKIKDEKNGGWWGRTTLLAGSAIDLGHLGRFLRFPTSENSKCIALHSVAVVYSPQDSRLPQMYNATLQTLQLNSTFPDRRPLKDDQCCCKTQLGTLWKENWKAKSFFVSWINQLTRKLSFTFLYCGNHHDLKKKKRKKIFNFLRYKRGETFGKRQIKS